MCDLFKSYATTLTLLALRHFAQTLTFDVAPFLETFTVWRFGNQRLLALMCEWLIVWPTTGPLPQTSQTRDIIIPPWNTRNKFTKI